MSNELKEIQELIVIEGRIDFPEYESIKASAEKLVAQLEQLEVTESNVKDSKKLIAALRKKLRSIDEERKFAKNVIMEPYEHLAKQIKEIESIVKVGENHVVGQIKELDRVEKENKRDKINDLFNKYIQDYDARHFIGFDDFIKDSMLTKSAKLTTIETDIISFLKSIDDDLQIIDGLDDNLAVLAEYKRSLDLRESMGIVQSRKLSEAVAKRQKAKQSEESGEKNDNDSKITSFEVYTLADAKKLTDFLESNNINYKSY